MILTREQEGMLAGKTSLAEQLAMDILVAYGECMNAKRMIPITSAHIAGNYTVMMDEGIEWLEDLVREGEE
jgi:predicted aconitase